MFADPAAGPGLGTSGNYQYVLDGGCPAPNRFDELEPVSGVGAVVSATYNNVASPPTKTGGAAIARMTDGRGRPRPGSRWVVILAPVFVRAK
jgi:hypothetical protein